MTTKRVIAVLSVLALAGCSGGGSESAGFGTPRPFTSFSEVTDDGVTQFEGEAITATLEVDGGGDVTIGSPSALQESTAVLTTNAGDAVALQITANRASPQSAVQFDTRFGDQAVNGTLTRTYSKADNSQVAVIVNPGSTNFEYQTFGTWASGLDGGSGGTIGVGTYGAATQTANMPAPGTTPGATYTGISSGIAEVNGDAYATSSLIQVETTDYTTATISSTLTQGALLESPAPSPPVSTSLSQLDFSGSGAISGNRFSATVSGGSVAGASSGRFYGPAAEEVGGTFTATGTDIRYQGAFGARQ